MNQFIKGGDHINLDGFCLEYRHFITCLRDAVCDLNVLMAEFHILTAPLYLWSSFCFGHPRQVAEQMLQCSREVFRHHHLSEYQSRCSNRKVRRMAEDFLSRNKCRALTQTEATFLCRLSLSTTPGYCPLHMCEKYMAIQWMKKKKIDKKGVEKYFKMKYNENKRDMEENVQKYKKHNQEVPCAFDVSD
ncbi:unnamed protein product [Bursaphelenchus okinawaensis]|uniref:Uncharacterized protein n=1 Tax=Bursaphelenchus okinawaensis TaxID=465554 RepID=A0A811K6B0_9BILA|nr:unnamed protein product [Bursaphelenchus okinawaensis]CAG9092321.1 unnamed protein product [Bursaphelenchus okinawaensis]